METDIVVHSRYQLGALLGEGGMGAVFRAIDRRTGERVAIKSLKPSSVAHRAEDIERFLREGEALRVLDHPNIVKRLDLFREGDRDYLVMELVEGGSLDSLLRSRAPLPLERALALGLDLSDALSRAHHLGIVHRDVKPANVLLAPDGTSRLSDFGVAYFAERERLSGSGAVVGTLDYLSPETLTGETADARTDIWALGVVLFEMLAGRRPFAGEHAAATLHAILHAAPPELETLRPDCPIALVDLIGRMLEKNREQRLPSARRVGAELESIRLSFESRKGTESASARPRRAPAEVLAFAPTLGSQPPDALAALPRPATPFLGREVELAALARLFATPDVRLVTLVGPGGMGKSRLALETARRFIGRDGPFAATGGVGLEPSPEIIWVELAPLQSAELVYLAIAEAVGFEFYPGGEPKAQLLGYLRTRRALLVLDNFEHVLEAAGLVSEILQAAPNLRVVATSRERLGLHSENVYALSGLAVPPESAVERFDEFSGIRLFRDSAKRVKLDFELTDEAARAAAQICRAVQGLPLGIVLAASWANVLTPREIADEVAKSFEFLSTEHRDMPARQHSLRAVFDYSYELLGQEERAVFARLSVFRGGFTRAAAEAVTGAGLRILAALMNKSLIARDPSSGRYAMHELVRQYAETRLVLLPGEGARVADAHARHCAVFLAERTARFKGDQPQLVAAEIEGELDNVRLAWSYLLRTEAFGLTNAVLEALEHFYAFRSAFVEAEEVFKAAALRLGTPAPERGSERERVFARAVSLQARACEAQWRNAEAIVLSTRALALLDEQSQPLEVGNALLVWAIASLWEGNVEPALEASERALFLYRRVGDPWETAKALARLGRCEGWLGGRKAEAYVRESIELQRSLTGGAVSIPESLTDLGGILAEQGKYAEGCGLLREGLALLELQGKSYGRLECLHRLATAERKRGDYAAAEVCARRALALAREMFPFAETWSLALLAEVLMARGQLDDAAVHWRALLADGNPLYVAVATLNLGDIACQRGERAAAAALFSQSLADFERQGASWGVTQACDCLGHQACDEGRYAEADELFRRAIRTAVSFRLLPHGVSALAGIARVRVLCGELERAIELLTLIERHPVTERQTFTRRVEPLIAEIASRLPAPFFAAAMERGRLLELDLVLADLSVLG